MTRTKPMLALGLLGAGIAAFSLAVYTQRERSAFTTQTVQRLMPEVVNVVPPPRPLVTVQPVIEPPTSAVPTIRLEELPVLPKPRLNKPAARPQTAPAAPAVEPNPCQPMWRTMESGPAGRRVRELCPMSAPKAEVPRS